MNEATSRSLGAGARVIALDIGASSVKFALIDESGQLGGTGVEELVLNQQRLAASQLAQLIRTQFDGGPPAAVGVTAPGIVDASTGVVRHSANLEWQNFALGDELSELLDIPVVVSHDVYSAGVAEHHLGAARGVQNAIITVLGTGISSALLVDGAILAAGGYAGEMGHGRIPQVGSAEAIDCSCGAAGCLQTLASASGLIAGYARRSGQTLPNAQRVFEAAAARDPAASETITAGIDALALSLAQCVALLGPEVIVLGGGMAQAGPALFDPLARTLDSLLSFHRRPRLVKAELGRWAGTFGAALAARAALGSMTGDSSETSKNALTF